MRLIGTSTSPFTRKVRIVALERKLPLQFVVDMPLAENTAVPLFNPLGKVPVLVHDDGSTLIDSSLIAAWLDRLGDAEGLLPEAEPERTLALQWEAVADGVLDAAVLMRMESLRPEGERSSAWVQRQTAKVERGLQWMARELGTREWCVEDRFTLADVAVGCCMAYLEFRFPDHGWRGRFTTLDSLVTKLEARPSFKATPMHA